MKNLFNKSSLVVIAAGSILFSSNSAFAVLGKLASGTTGIVNCEAPGVQCHPSDPLLDVGTPPAISGASATISQNSKVAPVAVNLAITIPKMLPNTSYSVKLGNCTRIAVTTDALGALKMPSRAISCSQAVQADSAYLLIYLGASTKIVRRSKGGTSGYTW